MEDKILSGLSNLGYDGPLTKRENFKNSLNSGVKNVEFTKLISYLTNELKKIMNLDETVNPITSPEDSAAFVMELTSFLKELNCPYNSLIKGHASDRFQTYQERQILLDYLITELMTAIITKENEPKINKIDTKSKENQLASDLKEILITLGFSKPPPNITVQTLFQKLIPSVESVIKKADPQLLDKPIFNRMLTEKEWKIVEGIYKDLKDDYKIRKEMLLTRLDVTIQSFQWSDRTKGKEERFDKSYKEKRKNLKTEPSVQLSELLSARTDLAIIEKTSNSSVRKNTGTSIHKIIIGQVPDRGGRTNEIAPPPPEMPSWQQRTPGPSGRGGGGGGGGFRGQYSRGDGNYQSTGIGRGNNYVGTTTGGFKSSFNNYDNKKQPFSNFDTSLSSYTKLSTNCFKTDQNQSSSSSNQYDSPNKRTRYENTSTTNQYYNNYNQKRSFDVTDREDGRNTSQDMYDNNDKRAKSYDHYQTQRSTYSEEYVKDNYNNQQYQQRNDGRGRSNYRGGRGRGGGGRGRGGNYR